MERFKNPSPSGSIERLMTSSRPDFRESARLSDSSTAVAESYKFTFRRYLMGIGDTRSAGQQSSLTFHVFEYGETLEIAGMVSDKLVSPNLNRWLR
jgi:hypothetical protein